MEAPAKSLVQNYPVEQRRGYEHQETQESPGYYRCQLEAGETVSLVISTDGPEALAFEPELAFTRERERQAKLLARAPEESRTGFPARLVLAADSYIIDPVARPDVEEAARARGQDARSVIAGYPWFTDWGRDTMISLEGLTIATGRVQEAGYILRTFAKYVKDGLIPNMFPEGKGEGLYHTADATLWFFHATRRYVDASGDRYTLRGLLPILTRIIERHVEGTHFGIHVDPKDGLLAQGAAGYQLTWMDAKVGDLEVTPRRGKAVEINALWYNALRLMEEWAATELHDDAAATRYRGLADRVRDSFTARFWNERTGCLFDIVDGEDGNDDAIRPNQLFSISMPHPVLDPSRWEAVLEVVRERLLTPYGLRTLAPSDPDYQAQYFGDLRARDLAYHQGTVWPWLIGPYFDAWRRVYPDRIDELRPTLISLGQHLASACVGSISEIFDAEPPFTPRGCCAQAWSVAEAARVLAEIGELQHAEVEVAAE